MVAAWCLARRAAAGVRYKHGCDLVHETTGLGLVPAPMYTMFVAVAASSTEHDQPQSRTPAHNNTEQQQK